MVRKPSIVNSQKSCPFEEDILCKRAAVVMAIKYSERPWHLSVTEYTGRDQYPSLTDCMACVYFPKKYGDRVEKKIGTEKAPN